MALRIDSPMREFLARYPDYAQTGELDSLRDTEYSYLDERHQLYLDYTGSGLTASSQLRTHQERLTGAVFGNPHSSNPTSQASTALVNRARRAVLRHFNAAEDEYAVVFTANATGACRLVGESYQFRGHGRFVLTADNHNSVNGIREFAKAGGARTVYIPSRLPDLRVSADDVRAALRPWSGLFAYPAQSNFSGVQHPLEWIEIAQKRGYDVLLDAAAYVPTNNLDLSEVHPEFVAVSWYKVFGYPTGVGCLLARREALAKLKRPWFSGGTINAVGVQVPWHAMAGDEAAFEDGTVNFLAIPDVETGLSVVDGVGMDVIGRRVRSLTGWFLDRLTALRHTGGAPMARVYGPVGTESRGGTVSFNLLDPDGRVVDERVVAKESAAAGISLRTGCFCNPGAGENAFGLTRRSLWRLRKNRDLSMDQYVELLGLPSGGAVRVSFGLVSNVGDVERFITFAEHTYRDRRPETEGLPPREGC